MKKIICAFLLVLLMVSGACADVEINAENFPDDAFRAYVSKNFDTDSNGILSSSELYDVAVIEVVSSDISSLKGIEHFTFLTGLNCRQNNITELDLSGNAYILGIFCDYNKLQSLDLSGKHSLLALTCSSNGIAQLNIEGCDKILSVDCSYNKLKSLSLKGLQSLRSLECYTQGFAVEDLTTITNDGITALDLKECTALEILHCSGNSLTGLDVSGLSSLKEIDCQDNTSMTSLKATNCTSLTKIDCKTCALTEIELSGCSSLNELNCYQNQLTLLDVSQTGLTSLICSSNLIETLTLNEGLQQLQCANNNLSSLNVSLCKGMTYIDCDGNRLTELDVSANTNLYVLSCNSNQLKALDLSKNTELESLMCRFNHIAALDLSNKSWLGYHGAQYVKLGRQSIEDFAVSRVSDSSYPFEFDFSTCVPSEYISRIIASSVKGFDEDNSDIETVYENGKAKFALLPAGVMYTITTGHSGEYISNVSMDVRVGSVYFFSVSFNNHVYRAFSKLEARNWKEAKEYCESLGGHLVTITSEQENEVIADLIDKIWDADEEKTYYWLGGNYEDGAWHWVTGEDFSFRPSIILRISDNWNFLHTSGNYQLWQCDNGNDKMGFICEWEPTSADFIPFITSKDDEAFRKDKDFSGYLEDPRDLSNLMSDPPKVSIPVTLPAKFDPRTSGRTLPAVRNQGSYGTCWSFASIGALETSYMTKFGKTVDLSELHQAWFVFKDPRKGYAQTISNPSAHVLSQGGIASYSVHFLSGIGPTSENSLAYDNATISNIERLTAGKYPEDYPHPVRLKDAYELGNISAKNRDSMMKIIKNLVYEYGSIEVGYNTNSKSPGFNAMNTSYYLPDSTERTGGHAVQIVGWDDNYSRTNFKNNPGIDGAWLIKNSWGANWGDGGYFWLSYGQYLHNVSAYIPAEFENSNMYGHDALAANYASNYRWGASVFRAVANENLSAVAFYTRENNLPYKIYIKVHGKDQPTTADFTIPATPSAEGTQDYAGYHTVNLASPVPLKAGEYFTVILNLGGIAPWMVMENDNDNGRDMTSVVTTAGKTFFSRSTGNPAAKEWVDGKSITGGSFNASIRAFTGTVSGGGGIIKPSITTSSLPDGTVGHSYTAMLSASGSVPIQWTASGLPGGLTCDGGTIKGTPSAKGSYSITVTAENSSGKDSKTLSLRVNDASSSYAPSITTSSLPNGTVGYSYTAMLSASGSVPIQWTASGLPGGLTCDGGTIKGIPSAEGSYSITVTAKNSSGKDSKTLSLRVNDASNPDNPDNNVGSSSGGGGGCSSSIPSVMVAVIFALTLSKRNKR